MIINMNDNPIFPKVINCNNSGIPIVNCQHWTSTEDCKTKCFLNVKENPSAADCFTCTSRKGFTNKLVQITEENKVIEINDEIKIEKKDGDYSIIFMNQKNKEEIVKKVEKNKLEEKKPSFIDKTINYLQAESSQATQGKVSEKVFQKRKEICMNCEFRHYPQQNTKNEKGRVFTDSIGWCKGGCGCGVGTPRAALSVKLYMPTLSCPKGKFGPETGSGFSVSDALDSAKGVVNSVANLFKQEKTDK